MEFLDRLPTWLTFPLGLVLLVAGAEWLVRGAAKLATSLGITPLIIGLTVVAFGTSAPELAVSVQAGLNGNGEIALGNVVGSNIANVLLILGISALIVPLTVHSQLVKLDVPIMIGVSAMLWLLCLDGLITRPDGAILCLGLISYVGLLAWLARRGQGSAAVDLGEIVGEADPARLRSAKARLRNLLLIALGLVLLVLGAHWLVNGATTIARAMNVSDLVIGLTVVAVGTSLPELATSIMASVRDQRDIAVGNIVGSNIFNILCVLGVSAFATPQDFPVPSAALQFDIPMMFAVAVATFPIFFTGGRINRLEGGLLLGYFIAYTAYLLLNAAGHDAAGPFSSAMLAFALPLTALGLLFSLSLSVHRRRRDRRVTTGQEAGHPPLNPDRL